MLINVSARGNGDILVIFFILLFIKLYLEKSYLLSAFFYGFAVHFRIYPIIYCIALFLGIDSKWPLHPSNFFTVNRIKFTIVSAATTLIIIFYYFRVFENLYGNVKAQEMLYETYLYHSERRDPRHNYSIFFYCTYLNCNEKYYNVL